MYSELYEAWKNELQNPELEKLPNDFYARIADYVKRLKEESRMLDKRTVKARLLQKETENVKRMIKEIVHTRYRKLLKKASEAEKAPAETLTKEEEKFMEGVLPLTEAFQTFLKNLLQGQIAEMNMKNPRENTVLRFLKDVPSIIGADMKPYGPFKAEDVASVPNENAKILIKQGLAEKIETD
ncbi:MAG: hypothetical protein QW840_02380 [Candidatus Bathyarchaeia archaeon]